MCMYARSQIVQDDDLNVPFLLITFNGLDSCNILCIRLILTILLIYSSLIYPTIICTVQPHSKVQNFPNKMCMIA